MPLTAQQVDTYRRDGVLPVGPLIDMPTVNTAREHLDALRTANHMDSPSAEPDRTSFRLLNAVSTDEWLWTIVKSPCVIDAATSLLGPDVQYFQDNIFWKPAKNGSSTQWHQDNIWWHVDPPEDILTIWIALDDVDPANGAVKYVRGSHTHMLDPDLPVEDPKGSMYSVLSGKQVDPDKVIQFSVPAGHGVVHHPQIIHGADPNNSDRPRRGYTVHLMAAGTKGADNLTSNPLLAGRMPVS